MLVYWNTNMAAVTSCANALYTMLVEGDRQTDLQTHIQTQLTREHESRGVLAGKCLARGYGHGSHFVQVKLTSELKDGV